MKSPVLLRQTLLVMPTAWVISGGARFGDPWHPFAETSAELRSALEQRGWAVEMEDDADAALAALIHQPLPSLLVVNIGWYGPDRFTDPATDGLVSALERGLPTLLVHSTLTAFPEWPLWHEIAGGGWTYGSTYHPEYGPAVAVADPNHPLTAGLDELAIADERYTKMWVDPSSRVFLRPRSWGGSPIVADTLGHNAASYQATGRATLLQRELDWLSHQ